MLPTTLLMEDMLDFFRYTLDSPAPEFNFYRCPFFWLQNSNIFGFGFETHVSG